MTDSTQSFTVTSKTQLELLVLWKDVKFDCWKYSWSNGLIL